MYTNVCVTLEKYIKKYVVKKNYISFLFLCIISLKIHIKYTHRKNYENFMNLYVSLKDKKYFEPTLCIYNIRIFFIKHFTDILNTSPHKITNTSVSKFSLKQSHLRSTYVRTFIYHTKFAFK